jgi:HSP20 family protein
MLMNFDPFLDFDHIVQKLWGSTLLPVAPMDVLTVSGRRSWQPGEGVEIVVSERPQGSFSRRLYLGENLDTEKIEASYDKGVLTITIPVAESAKPRRVQIGTSETGETRALEASAAA